MFKKFFTKVAEFYGDIREFGSSFAQGAFASTAKKYMKADLPEDDKKTFAGVAAVTAGGLGKTATYVGIGIAAIGALVSPFTLPALVSYIAFGAVAAASIQFARGLEEGGDKLSGVLTMRDGLRQGIFEMAREDVKSWTKKQLSPLFKNEAAKDKPAAEAPKPAPQLKPEDAPKL